MSENTLAVVVPATNRPPTLERCVAAIRDAERAPDEIVVVDKPAGAGPAAARNAGVARAEADVVAFVDSDVVVHRDAFSRLREAFEDPGLDALFGSYDDAPEAPGAVAGFRNLLHHQVHQESPGPARTFWAGLGAVRRRAFLDAGGFDESRYREPSIEDIELGMRLAATGARIELDPGLQGTHLKSWTLADTVRTDFARRGVPWVRLLVERREVPDDLNLAWRHRASAAAAVAGIAALAARRPAAVAGSAAAMVLLNRSFYALLLRRRGAVQAAAGVGLHAIHHAVGAASIPAGIADVVLRSRLRERAQRRRARDHAGRLLLDAFADAHPEPVFIEIGANDGVAEDHLAPFVRRHRWRGVMVEPVPHVFERLRRNYEDVGGVALENAAIASHDGTAQFHILAPTGEAGRAGLDGGDLFGSLRPDSVEGIWSDFPELDRRLDTIEVPCMSFESLCRRHGIDSLDLLVIDTEGYDQEILAQVDIDGLRPRIVVYEYCHMPGETRREWEGRFEAMGYELMDEGLDTWCVDARPDDALTRRWREIRARGPSVSEEDLGRWFEGVRRSRE